MKRIYQYLLRNTAQAGSPYTLALIYLPGFAPSQTLGQWNAQLGGNYTNLSVVGDNIILTGGSNVAFPNGALQGESQLIEIQDDGSVISCGDLCFDSSGLQNVSLSAVTTIGPNCFSNCLYNYCSNRVRIKVYGCFVKKCLSNFAHGCPSSEPAGTT